jgi:hypothetical protein
VSTVITVVLLFLAYVWLNLMAMGLEKCGGAIEVTCPHIAAAIYRAIWLAASASAAVVFQWYLARRLSRGWRLALGLVPPVLSLLALLSAFSIVLVNRA